MSTEIGEFEIPDGLRVRLGLETSVPQRGEEWRCRWASPRAISTAQLKHLHALHLRPIDLVVYEGPYPVNPVGDLILESASRLDAFSAYPNRTWLPGGATGVTTGTLAVRSTRSSRTRVNPPQVSCAHGG